MKIKLNSTALYAIKLSASNQNLRHQLNLMQKNSR